MNLITRVVIPAFNEQNAVGKVIHDIPKDIVAEVIVVDNGSTDDTKKIAAKAGATVLHESRQGYGSACLKGIEYINTIADKTNIVVFIDADYSDHPEEMNLLLAPIVEHQYDMVIGSRALGVKEKGAMTPPQIFGNWLATRLLKLLYSIKFTDLGPFRAIRLDSLNELKMKDTNYGWTVEMQLKAAKKKLRCTEIPVNYRKRVGHSKISGTVKGTILAGYKIIWTIIKYAW